ncbi:Co2+/Mg2+ efflux protein ApaG [Thauera sp. Sel9]|uniref:Co2+/Mg2+ efflux protein ApaG n=1 Tax=Thauera sp. Sel9 TaxID=2974299 RepID=UPI0021E160E0|nr:Co2+/Mg2+ efflux protein ApaG [Thauera sp. Sel9]MCV2218404.1 Co2+/Mg2+ efflux protein ApaG [Thauera sp. Sel9]
MNTPDTPASPYRIEISARAEYIAAQSRPDEGHYVFAYHISLRNTGSLPAQLISRHWIITDGNSKVQDVRGKGVVGEQPLLAPGESFGYTSGCVLETPVGTMHGSYQMVAGDGHRFDAAIPPFMLAMPHVLH